MPNQYWEKRMQEIEKKSHEIGLDYAKYTERQFNLATRAIDKKISYWYQKMAENNGVSLAAAKSMLRKDELEEFHWSVEEYIKKGEILDYDKKWESQLINASAKVHISRLEAMKLQIQQECEVLYGNLSDGLDKTMTEIYTQGYYHTAYELMRGTKLGTAFNLIDSRKIEKAVQTAWANDGKNFTARCWENKNKLINELNTILTQNIIRGEAPGKAIDQLSKKMKVSRYNAGRLIMTESAFIGSKCQSDCYKDLGVEKFEFVATLDGSTSEICREMDGKVFNMSDYKIGLNAPPLHCFCRSCTVPYFEEDFGQTGKRAARGEDGKTTYVTGNMTYEEWEKRFVDEREDFANSAKSSTIVSGAVSGARNPYGEKAKEHAKRYYGSVRKMTTDVEKISEVTGISKDKIQDVKNFIFLDKHDLGGKELEYFEPDYMMAESWRRLIEGKPEPHDITMLKHEIMERELINNGMSQQDAHIATSKKYNYDKEATEFYGKIKKYRKE